MPAARRNRAFVDDRERGVLEAIARLATSNPFLPERIEDERRALGDRFEAYAPVWHMDRTLLGLNPNILSLNGLAEQLAEDLRGRLAAGARASEADLRNYEGLIRYLIFYRYAARMTQMIEARETSGKPADRKIEFFPALRDDYDHFLRIPGVTFPVELDAAHTLAWGFQIRRAFHYVYTELFGASMPMARLRGAVWQAIFTHDAERYRRALYRSMEDIPVLVLGASGTGKELVSRAVGLSRYIAFDPERQAFVADYASGFQAVNLSALSSALIESELFGHKRGAFTGATSDRVGWFESCGSSGTIFLDEIGELDPAIQVKLLRVLQTRVFQRIGETEDRRFEGKIIAATNRDLEREIDAGRFREDLYFRLCANIIRMPTLYEQLHSAAGGPGEDELASLVGVVARRIAGDEGAGLADEAMRWMRAELPDDYAWPGNVRELEQCLRSILVQGSYAPPRRSEAAAGAGDGIAAALLAGEASADDLLREYATRVYVRVGSYEGAARTLGIDRRTVKAKIDPELLAELQREG